MKRLIFILFLSTALAPAFAQSPGQKARRQIEVARVAFITQKLDLSTEEAQQFWPVYNNYQHELEELNREKRMSRMQRTKGPDQALDDELEFETRILDLKKRYRKEFTRVLSAQKVGLLFQAERDFREQLIKRLNHRPKN